jgi:hypothetical protein
MYRCARGRIPKYDEIDVESEQAYVHEVLLSDGRQITLRFFQFDYFVYHSRIRQTAVELAAT